VCAGHEVIPATSSDVVSVSMPVALSDSNEDCSMKHPALKNDKEK
jgi:hypothetical protein